MTIFERGDLPKIEIEINLTFIRTPISRFHWNIHRMINQKIRKNLPSLIGTTYYQTMQVVRTFYVVYASLNLKLD